MYHHLLTEAMKDPDRPDISGGLLEALVSSRDERVRAEQRSTCAADRISCEIAYDRALIEICRAMGITACPDGFLSPISERHRLETSLADLGPVWSAFVYPDRAATSLTVVPDLGEEYTKRQATGQCPCARRNVA
jgi:hypothetical protein